MSLVFSLGIVIRRQTGTSAPAPATRPVNTMLPAITGTARQGQVLSSDTGGWMGNPTSLARQWRRNGAAILGATAASYMLQAADVGSTISVTVTAANAQGTTTATSTATAPVAAAASDYFVVALQGQSGAKYVLTMGRTGEFNPTDVDRSGTTITGTWGHAVEMVPKNPGVLPREVIDREITQTNYTTVSDGYIVSRSSAAVARFMRFMDPTRVPVVVLLAKSGESMAGLLNDADDTVVGGDGNYGWSWQDYKYAVDHVEATYGPFDLLVTHWYGSAPSHINPVRWMGELADGTKHILGRAPDNTVPTGGNVAVDHYLFDVNPGGTNHGTFPYNEGMKLAYSIHPNPNVDPALRAAVSNFFNDPRLAPMNLGNVIAPNSGHILDSDDGGAPLVAMSIMGPAILKALGIDDPQPSVAGMTAASDGSYVDVTVNLPNGGNLTTVRTQRDIPAPSSPAATSLPVYGFTSAAPGAGVGTQRNLRRAEWDAAIINTGTGAVPNRTGTVRLTPVTPIPTGTQIAYRLGGTGTDNGGAIPQEQYSEFDFLIEEVPSLMEPGAEFPFPGYPVQPMSDMTFVAVGAAQPQPFATTGPVAGTTAVIPAGTQVGDVLVAIANRAGNSLPADDANWTTRITQPSADGKGFSFRVASRVYEAGDAAPVFANANDVEILRFGPGHSVGAHSYAYAGAGTVLTAPAVTLTGASAWEGLILRSRSANQTGWTPTALPGWNQVSPGTQARRSYYNSVPVTSMPAVDAPGVVGTGTGGASVLHLEIVRP